MRPRTYKAMILAGMAVAAVLAVHNAIAGATFPVEPIVLTIADLKMSDTIDMAVELIEVSPIESTVPAVGDNELNAVEVSSISDLSNINTMLTKSNWKYVTQILEAEPDTLKAGTYKAELFENDELKDVLFFKQGVANNEMIEGVTAIWDIGNEIPTNAIYTVKVTKSPINLQGGDTIR